MSKFTLNTLTPIHIGSGTDFQGNFEYLYFKDRGVAVVLDQEKTLDVLGEDKISDWITCIDKNESLLALLESRRTNLDPEDVALRTMNVVHAGLSGKNSLREQLHDGMGRPFLPGSSIKGAIRTALFANFIHKNGHIVKNRTNLLDRKRRFSDRELIKRCFGPDPNHDFLRLLQVGDVHFNETACYKSNVVNLSGEEWIKGSNTQGKDPMQFIEAIPANKICEGVTLQLDNALYKVAETRKLFNRDITVLQFNQLLPLINTHTRSIVEREISYWKEEGNPEVIENYLEELNTILDVIQACEKTECVLRLGWGTGYRNITGAWQKELEDDEYFDLIKDLRPKHPEDLVYPKTTRLLDGGVPMGFIKLSL